MIQEARLWLALPIADCNSAPANQALGGPQGTPVFEPLLGQQRIAIKTDLSACPVLCAYISGKAVVPLRPLECGAT